MYSYIKGELVDISEDTVVVENNGIGYNIRVPASMLDSIAGIGQEVKIYTYTYVREDAILLYGFPSRDDRNVFCLLIGVSGIGPKGALAILSVMTSDDLRFAILGDDEKTIAKAPGIGKKTASRLILELRDKLNLEAAFHQKKNADSTTSDTVPLSSGIRNEAIQALCALGYAPAEALKAVNHCEIMPDTTVEELLKAALRQMTIL